MKNLYESFAEIADAFVDGEKWTHRLADHSEAECFAWMHGVREFAAWLDRGIAVPQEAEVAEKLWDSATSKSFGPLTRSGRAD